ncbi:MAG: hypothetical protein V4613_03690 [Bacteroidota bacterium]
MSKIKIGIAGNNDSVNVFLNQINSQPAYEFVGVFDSTNPDNYKSFYGLEPFNDFLKRTDAVIFAGNHHLNLFDNMMECIKYGKNIMVEKFNGIEYYDLIRLQKMLKEAGSYLYFANITGTQSAYTTFRQLVNKPVNLSAQVHIPYVNTLSPADKNNLLAETVDLILRSVNSPVAKIKVNKHFIFHQQPDEVKIHLLFDNGCVADVVFNLFGKNAINTISAYQKGKIVNADLANYKVEETRLDMKMENQLQLYSDYNSNVTITNKMEVFEKKIMYFDAIQKDLLNFVDCITNHVSPLVGIEEAINVAGVLQQIQYTQHESFV